MNEHRRGTFLTPWQEDALQRVGQHACWLYVTQFRRRRSASRTVDSTSSQLAEPSGLGLHTVTRALRALAEAGLIRRVRRGTRGRATVWEVPMDPPGAARSGAIVAASAGNKGRIVAPGAPPKLKSLRKAQAPTEAPTEQQQQDGAAAGAGISIEPKPLHPVLETICGRLGIMDSKVRSELAAFEGLHLVANKLATEAGRAMNPAGLFLTKVRQDAQGLIEQHRKRSMNEPLQLPPRTAEEEALLARAMVRYGDLSFEKLKPAVRAMRERELIREQRDREQRPQRPDHDECRGRADAA